MNGRIPLGGSKVLFAFCERVSLSPLMEAYLRRLRQTRYAKMMGTKSTAAAATDTPVIKGTFAFLVGLVLWLAVEFGI